MLYQLGLDLGILRRSGKPIGKSKHDLYRCFRAGEYPPPSGDPTPPRADIDMTKQIADAAKPLGIALQDHIIIGREGHASLKGLRLI